MKREDSKSETYQLVHPVDLKADAVAAWVYTLSGALRAKPPGLFGERPRLVLELVADENGISHRLRMSREHAGFIVPQLRSLVPGTSVMPAGETGESVQWTAAVELGQTNPSRTLSIPDPEPVSASLLANMQGLGRNERLIVQWVISPAARARPPQLVRTTKSSDTGLMGYLVHGVPDASRDEVNDRREKLSEPNFLSVLRIAAHASNYRQAQKLITRVRSSVASVRSPYNGFKQRLTLTSGVVSRLQRGSGMMLYPAQVSASELVALLGWPIGSPHVAGLPTARTCHLAATGAIPKQGLVIARSNFPGAERLIALDPVEAAQHLQIVGPTNSGKTALMTNLAVQSMMAGRGVVVVESKGDLFRNVLDRVPKHRLDDVVLLDVTDTDHPTGYNVLQGSPYVVASDIQRLFDHLYPQDTKGVRVRQGFYHLILTLLLSKNGGSQMTFPDIEPLAVPRGMHQAFADSLIRGVSHVPELAMWWQSLASMNPGQRENYFRPLMDRTWQLNSRRAVRNIIGQSTSTIDLWDIIRNRKILLVNLGRATEGTDTASLLGSLILNAIWSTVKAGAADPANPTSLILDEFQDFLNLPISPSEWFAQARSYGLAVTVAHQHIKQLSAELQEATATNARSTVVFQTSADEARYFARQFGRSVTEDDFMNQRRFDVILRLATRDGVSSPVTGVTLPPVDPTGFADRIRESSRSRFARPIAEVEEAISKRRQVEAHEAQPKRTRRFGGRAWNEG